MGTEVEGRGMQRMRGTDQEVTHFTHAAHGGADLRRGTEEEEEEREGSQALRHAGRQEAHADWLAGGP